MNPQQYAYIAALFLTITGGYMTLNQQAPLAELQREFNEFKVKYSKTYGSTEEEITRFAIFTHNLNEIQEHNAQNSEYEKGENQFTDLTEDEFVQIYLKAMIISDDQVEESDSFEEPLGDVNWVEKGDVQKVKDQGQCGSCWAFSAAATTESASAIFGPGLGDFSESQLNDCDTRSNGCQGGINLYAFDWYAAHGICTEKSYPYKAKDGTCKESSCTKSSFKIKGYTRCSSSVSGLKTCCNKAPVSVAVDASTWSSYKSGIMSSCGTAINHAVLLAGYTSSYWLIKNSWGTSWGESGYIRLKGNTNTCNIVQQTGIARL